jgi:hypothetical protein
MHLLFQASLHGGIDGEYHIASRSGCHKILIRKGHIHLVISLGGDDSAAASLQIAVVGRFDALRTGIGSVCKTDDLGSQRSKRICPLRAWLQMDAGNAILVDKAADL